MRTSRLILTIGGLLICSILLLGYKPVPKIIEEIKEIRGTWHNRDYDVIENKYAKIKFTGDNRWFTFSTTASREPTKNGRYTIVEGWRGKAIGESRVYYKVIRTSDDGMKKYELYRFTEVYQYDYKGKVLEIVSSKEDFPAEINPNSSTYSILYIRNIGPIGEVFVYIILLLVCLGAVGTL